MKAKNAPPHEVSQMARCDIDGSGYRAASHVDTVADPAPRSLRRWWVTGSTASPSPLIC
jgi:hypothetical protein